jgi:hypothetical protein
MNKKKNTPQAKKQLTKRKWLSRVLGFRSVLITSILCLIVYNCVTKIDSYNWVWNGLLKSNYELTKKYPNMTLDERLSMKLGLDYSYLKMIRENTPDTAVILFQEKQYITEKVGTQALGSIVNKMWVTHFLYPRTILYKEEKETNPYYNKITHIAITAGHGYDDLDYSVSERQYFTILPKYK